MKRTFVLAMALLFFCFSAGCNTPRCKDPQDCYEQGLKQLEAQKREQAYRYLSKAANDDPTNVTYQWAAARIAPNPKFALFHVKTAWDNGLRNRETLDAYLNLSQITGEAPSLLFALQLYRQLPDSLRTDELRAGIYLNFKLYDSTVAILKELHDTKPTQASANGLARAYLAKNDISAAKAFLLKAQGVDLLNAEGFLLLHLAYLRDFDYAGCAGVFDAAKKAGLYNDELRLAQARGLVAQEKLDDAEALLKPMLDAPAADPDGGVLRNARMVMSYLYLNKGKKEAIEALRNSLPGDTGFIRIEKMYYDALRKRMGDTASLVPILTELLKKIPAYPEIQIVLAQELQRAGKNSEAFKVYQNLPDVYLGSPRIIIERARLIDLAGKSSDALAMLSLLHSKKIATKASLELFRDISFKKNMTDEADQAQKILEKAYKNNVGIRWARGVMHLKNGKNDSAMTVFSLLSAEYPKEPRFLYALLSAMYNKGDYELVVRECTQRPSDAEPVLRLQARAYSKLKQHAKADSLYRRVMAAEKSGIGAKIEYAEFLQHSGNPDKAAAVYRELVEKNIAALGGDTSRTAAVVLNNLAWSLLQTQTASKDVVLPAIKKAYEIDQQNPSILDTYAEALLRFNDFRGCLKLLELNPLAVREPALQLKLSVAYEGLGNLTKAVKTAQEVKKLIDSGTSGTVAATITSGEVQSRIESLLSRIKE